MTSADLRPARFLFAASLAVTAALAYLLCFRDGGYATWLVGALWLAGSGWAIMGRAAAEQPRLLGLFVSIALLNLLVVVPELGLRLKGFHYESGIQFGYPRPTEFASFAPHPELLWTMPPGRPGVNSLGFPGPEPASPKPAGLTRLLFLGDSCTQQGYPKLAELLLRAGGTEVECVTLAVSGYSSHQGRKAAELYGERLQPDGVFVYFGWNDHWQAYGATDAEKPPPVNAEPPLIERLGRRWVTAQVARKLADGWRGQAAEPLDRVRVPEADYVANLTAICRQFHAVGAPVVLLTAPTAFFQRGVPAPLIERRFVPNAATAIARHRRYLELTRQVAATEGAILLDLAAEFDRPEIVTAAFEADGIHLTQPGLALIAERVAEVWRDGLARRP